MFNCNKFSIAILLVIGISGCENESIQLQHLSENAQRVDSIIVSGNSYSNRVSLEPSEKPIINNVFRDTPTLFNDIIYRKGKSGHFKYNEVPLLWLE